MAEIGPKRPMFMRRMEVDPLRRLTRTLGDYYQRKQDLYTIHAPTTYDKDLHRIFSSDPRHRRSQSAAQFLRRNRTRFRQMVSKWTGEYQLTLDVVLDHMIARCKELKLRAVGPERQLIMDFTVLLTAKAVHSLHSPSRREWFAL